MRKTYRFEISEEQAELKLFLCPNCFRVVEIKKETLGSMFS